HLGRVGCRSAQADAQNRHRQQQQHVIGRWMPGARGPGPPGRTHPPPHATTSLLITAPSHQSPISLYHASFNVFYSFLPPPGFQRLLRWPPLSALLTTRLGDHDQTKKCRKINQKKDKK